MAKSILDEQPMTLVAAAKLLPPCRGGRPVSPATLWRWSQTGARGPGGRRVFLDAIRCGSVWLTSRAALDRFFATLSRSASKRRKAVRA